MVDGHIRSFINLIIMPWIHEGILGYQDKQFLYISLKYLNLGLPYFWLNRYCTFPTRTLTLSLVLGVAGEELATDVTDNNSFHKTIMYICTITVLSLFLWIFI